TRAAGLLASVLLAGCDGGNIDAPSAGDAAPDAPGDAAVDARVDGRVRSDANIDAGTGTPDAAPGIDAPSVSFAYPVEGHPRKIRPVEIDQAIMGSAAASVRGAGNEVVSFQVAVSSARSLEDVSFASALSNGTQAIPGAGITIYREEYVTVTSKTTGMYSTV